MRRLFLLLSAAVLISSCGGKDDEPSNPDIGYDKTGKNKDESTKGAWSDEDKDKYKADYGKTFKTMKQNLENDSEFDETDFNKQSKKVTSCMLDILENKYESYDDYKKASKKENFQQDEALMNKMADCQQDFMDKYNRE